MLILNPVKVSAVQSGGTFTQGVNNFNNSNSFMKMQGAAGSFTIGDLNIVNNPFNVNGNTQFDPDLVDMPKFGY